MPEEKLLNLSKPGDTSAAQEPSASNGNTAEHDGEAHQAVAPPLVAPQETPRSKPSRLIVFALLAVALLIGAVWGSRKLAYSRSHASTDDAAVNGDLYAVSSKVNGRIEKVFVSADDFVHRGQLLATLDARDIKAQLEQARAVLATEEANARAAGVAIEITQKTTGSTTLQARAAIEAARAQAEAARQQAQAGLSQVPSAQAAVGVERAGVEEARRSAQAGLSQLPSTQAAVRAAQAQAVAARRQVGVGRAQIAAAQAAVARKRLRCPQ